MRPELILFFAYFLVNPAFHKAISANLTSGDAALYVAGFLTVLVLGIFELIKRKESFWINLQKEKYKLKITYTGHNTIYFKYEFDRNLIIKMVQAQVEKAAIKAHRELELNHEPNLLRPLINFSKTGDQLYIITNTTARVLDLKTFKFGDTYRYSNLPSIAGFKESADGKYLTIYGTYKTCVFNKSDKSMAYSIEGFAIPSPDMKKCVFSSRGNSLSTLPKPENKKQFPKGYGRGSLTVHFLKDNQFFLHYSSRKEIDFYRADGTLQNVIPLKGSPKQYYMRDGKLFVFDGSEFVDLKGFKTIHKFKSSASAASFKNKELYIFENAIKMPSNLKLKYSTDFGVIKCVDDQNKIIREFGPVSIGKIMLSPNDRYLLHITRTRISYWDLEALK